MGIINIIKQEIKKRDTIIKEPLDMDNENVAVKVRNAYKHYGSKKQRVECLVNYNMTVQKGTIYGLLGPSGAGKTTLLSCLVGRKTLNGGQIFVFGETPGSKGCGVPGKRVGYMPQDLSLYGDFTMNDLMLYFGWICGLNQNEINQRTVFLMQLLNLPTKYRRIKNLSGGQKRRVSFAVALLHDPELLILDEPTVGVDPLLRKSIWGHLVALTKNGNKTIIITTHYIEEARQAHTIGLMRYGTILAEESPEKLLEIYKKSTLEEVFLQLSSEQSESYERAVHEVASAEMESKAEKHFKTGKNLLHQSPPRDKKTYKMRALLYKNVLRMWRNPGLILFFMAMPIVQVILFCVAIGGEPNDLKMAIVNEETVDKSVPFSFGSCQLQNLGERFLASFRKSTLNKEYYEDLQRAKKAVYEGQAWGVIKIPRNYSASLRELIMRDNQGFPSNDIIKSSQIYVWLDLSNQQIGFMLKRDIVDTYRLFVRSMLKDCKMNENLGNMMLSFEEPIYGAHKPSYTDFVAPGVILTIIFFLAVGQTAISLITEKLEGMFDRTLVAGVYPAEILASHVMVQFGIMLLQAALVLFFILMVFGVKCEGNLINVISLTLLQGVCGMCYGYVISAACDNEITAIQIALGSFYPCILLSGIIWPVEGMPKVLRILSKLSPLTLATCALRCIMSRGWGIIRPTVYMGYVTTVIWIALYLIVSFTILHFKKG